jgi:hypothetical protein
MAQLDFPSFENHLRAFDFARLSPREPRVVCSMGLISE